MSDLYTCAQHATFSEYIQLTELIPYHGDISVNMGVVLSVALSVDFKVILLHKSM